MGITEFASRNKAWEFYAKQVSPTTAGQESTRDDDARGKMTEFSVTPLPPMIPDHEFVSAVQTTDISWLGHLPEVKEGIKNQPRSPEVSKLSTDREITNSLYLTSRDKQHRNKPKHMVFSSSKNLNLTQDFDAETNPDAKQAYAENLAVDSLEITNSTHITRIKEGMLRREYKDTYPFINFQRPNIRAIIYNAASHTYSNDICVLTSGPKGMINECKRWAAEIGVDVHSEVFDW